MRINVGDKVRVDASMGYLHNAMGRDRRGRPCLRLSGTYGRR